jgi:superfamily II DNA/RNA helicase
MQAFKELGISSPILKSLEEHGFEKPSEIQEKTIKLVIEGKDVIAGASTGSGKTLAFGSGILQNTKKDFGIQALILTPTRELAEQIAVALDNFSKHDPLSISAIYGGVSIIPQIKQLEYADIVVGTPGRILDHLERGTIDFSNIKTLVLDEADRMLDMGFRDDVDSIINNCPIKRQTLLFSATISQDVVLLSEKYMKDPIEVSAQSHVDPTKLKQVYYDVGDNLKYSLLKHLLESEKAKLVMVFCNTRNNVDFVANNLKFMGIESLPIHGGFSQEKRSRILEQFHSKTVHVLVCTDVAARGLDIKGVSHIYNYDAPNDSNEYIHRIGRTARAGKQGKVINIISSRDYDNFRNVLDLEGIKIEHLETPYIQRARIRWMPETKGQRFARRHGIGRDDNRKDNRGGSRGSYSRGSDSRGGDRRSGSYGNRDNRGSSYGRTGDRRDSRGSRSGSYGGRDNNSRNRSSYGNRSSYPNKDSSKSSYGNRDNKSENKNPVGRNKARRERKSRYD